MSLEVTKLRNSLYYETLVILNLQPLLVDLGRRLFKDIPEGIGETLGLYDRHILQLKDYDPDYALEKAARLRYRIVSHITSLLAKAKLDLKKEVESLDSELNHVLSDCWNNRPINSTIEERLKKIISLFGEYQTKENRSLLKLCAIHQLWLQTLDKIERSAGDKGSWGYCYNVMKALQWEKVTFYHYCYKNTPQDGGINYTLNQLQSALQKLETSIEAKESALKCYSREKAAGNFIFLNITKNLFFSLGKEIFIAAENNVPGTKLEEPYLSFFCNLAGCAVLGGQIYLSPTVTGPAILIHALAQSAFSDTKRLKRVFGLSEEELYKHYSTIVTASGFTISLLTIPSESVAKLAVQLTGSHLTLKAVDHCSPSNIAPTAKIVTTLASNIFGFYLGSLAWQAGKDFAFEHLSNETLLFDDALCAEFSEKCLKEARDELCMLENAPLDEIKQQYRSLSLELHPDKNPGIDPLEFKRLAAAFKKLSDNSNKRI